MKTDTVVEITSDDQVDITSERGGQYGLRFDHKHPALEREVLFSKLTLLFPDLESLGEVIDLLHAKIENLRKPIEERSWM